MKRFLFFLFTLALGGTARSQPPTRNLVIVTLDGMRWQEVFGGIDETLTKDSVFSSNRDGLKKKFWAEGAAERRALLFPFLWHTVAVKGQLFGNRHFDNKMDNANPYWFSYPGYNEIFTGYPDSAINSNDKIYNPNENVLEFLNRQPGFKGKVAAFSSWDVFPYILNAPRSGIYVNADVDTLRFSNPSLQLINDMQFLTTRPIGVRPDIFTYMAGREYLKAFHPRVLYIAFDETDDFAHAGMYDRYIGSAHAEDGMLADLWKTLQSIPQYKDKTTLLVTCDHGRGDKIKSTWRDHGSKIKDSHQIWMAVMGPGIAAKGEQRQPAQLYQEQIAATLAALLGYHFKANHPVADPILSLVPANR